MREVVMKSFDMYGGRTVSRPRLMVPTNLGMVMEVGMVNLSTG